MKNENGRERSQIEPDEDTMRTEYDFSQAVRGATYERYGRGTNIVVLDPDVALMFPDSKHVNEALRALGEIIRKMPRSKSHRKSRRSA